MKSYSKIALLVVLVLFLSLTACTLKASKAPNVAKTPTGEVPFPVATPGVGGVASFGTQTAIALTPAGTTPQVVVTTDTPAAPSATPQASGGGQEQGGGQSQPSAPLANTPVVTRPANYTLQKGEWPICIARRYDLDLGTFFAQNGLNMNSKPAAGTTLRIPSSGNWSANFGSRSLKQHPTTYTVAAGDTVNTIACKFGDVTPEAIIAVNNLSNANAITVGQQLNIP